MVVSKLDNILTDRAKATNSKNVVLSKDAKNIMDTSNVRWRGSMKSRNQTDIIDDHKKEAAWVSGAHYEEEWVGRIDSDGECKCKEK